MLYICNIPCSPKHATAYAATAIICRLYPWPGQSIARFVVSWFSVLCSVLFCSLPHSTVMLSCFKRCRDLFIRSMEEIDLLNAPTPTSMSTSMCLFYPCTPVYSTGAGLTIKVGEEYYLHTSPSARKRTSSTSLPHTLIGTDASTPSCILYVSTFWE